MKQIISIILLVFMIAVTGSCKSAPAASGGKVETGATQQLINKYKGEEGFEVMSFGGLALGLVKMAANASSDAEDLNILDGIRNFVVVEYYDAAADKKAAFNEEMAELLKDASKIMEVKDDGDKVEIYGTLSKDGERISDVVLYMPEESSFVCFFGNIRTKDIGAVMEMTNE